MIGLPLRLLAREVYDKLSAILGERSVALITGEEKRIHSSARYFVCTVEAMPTDREVDFLAIDEIQLAAHPDRGHIFTERLLRARGRQETWFLGAETIAPLLRRLVPTAAVERRARLSVLRERGQDRLGSLPKRSAVVAFSVSEVYRLAEQLKHRKGGAAVVLGGLSPRARNAQVALYESGEVNYVVATDAIGMGLNLNIRHVAFAGLSKFDGRQQRLLDSSELAQIAGRAGRHLQSGSFGTLAPQSALRPGLARNIEEHRFPSLSKVYWRNEDLCFQSLTKLQHSLQELPRSPFMSASTFGADALALKTISQDESVRRLAVNEDSIELLWQVCQIPDYGRGISNLHATLVKEVFFELAGSRRTLCEDWLETGLLRLDRVEGDVDTLTARVAQLRTWAYLCNQSSWLADPGRWRGRSQDVEHRLSDALHARLVDRFVAHNSRVTARIGQPQQSPLEGSSDHPMKALLELRSTLLPAVATPQTTEEWIEELLATETSELHCDENGAIHSRQQVLAHLRKGRALLRPEIKIALEDLGPGQHLRLTRKLQAWSRDLVSEILEGLHAAPKRPWSPAGRGLLYQLEQSLGTVSTQSVRAQLTELTRHDRLNLRTARVFIGKNAVFCTTSSEKRWSAARFALSQTFSPRPKKHLPRAPLPTVFSAGSWAEDPWLWAAGYVRAGTIAVRANALEAFTRDLSHLRNTSPFAIPRNVQEALQCDPNQYRLLVAHLGYQQIDENLYQPRKGPKRRRGRARRASRN